MGIDQTVNIYRNPRRAYWESYKTDLSAGLPGMTDKNAQ
jgi:hypothetical protein